MNASEDTFYSIQAHYILDHETTKLVIVILHKHKWKYKFDLQKLRNENTNLIHKNYKMNIQIWLTKMTQMKIQIWFTKITKWTYKIDLQKITQKLQQSFVNFLSEWYAWVYIIDYIISMCTRKANDKYLSNYLI